MLASKLGGALLAERRHDAKIAVDVDADMGPEVYAHLTANGLSTIRIRGSDQSGRRTLGRSVLADRRAEIFWKLREALDPDQHPTIALPDDPQLLAELAALTYADTPKGLTISSRDEVRRRLGRIAERADAVAAAWPVGPAAWHGDITWQPDALPQRRRRPRVDFGGRGPRGSGGLPRR